MKKYVNPIVMVLIGVLICVLAEGVDQRTVVKKKNVKIDQSKLTYDKRNSTEGVCLTENRITIILLH